MNVGIGEIDIADFYPLRVVKQVLCSFLALINPDEPAQLDAACAPSAKEDGNLPPLELFKDVSVAYKSLPAIRRFVLDREATGFPDGVRLYMYLIAQPAGRTSSIGVIGSRSTGRITLVSEFAWWPIGWALFFEGEPWEPLLDVTDWGTIDYNAEFSMTLRLPCYWIEGKFPLDFRNPETVTRDAAIQQAIIDERRAAGR